LQRSEQVDALAGAEKFDGEDVAQIVEHAFEAAGAAHAHAHVVFLIAEVEIESTECGVARARFSLVSAAAVTCAIMKPELRPDRALRMREACCERIGHLLDAALRNAPSVAMAIAT